MVWNFEAAAWSILLALFCINVKYDLKLWGCSWSIWLGLFPSLLLSSLVFSCLLLSYLVFSGLVSSRLVLPCRVLSRLLLSCLVLACLLLFCLSGLALGLSCLVFSCLALPRLSFLLLLLPFTTKENSNLPGQKTKLNIESATNLSNNITKIIDFGTHFESILGPWADLGPPWDLKG